MIRTNLWWLATFALVVTLVHSFPALAADESVEAKQVAEPAADAAAAGTTESKAELTTTAAAYQSILKDTKPIEGMIVLYQQGGNLYGEFQNADYQSEYIVLISLARGVKGGLRGENYAMVGTLLCAASLGISVTLNQLLRYMQWDSLPFLY
jgi:hypothetical protein